MVQCKLCNKKFRAISNTHLESIHSLSVRDYISKFGSNGVGFSVSMADIKKNDPRYKLWRESLLKRQTGWSKGYTKETHPSLAKMALTFKKNKIDNFKKWREEQKMKGLMPPFRKPLKENKNLAFLIGLVLGDGNIYKFPRTECLRIALAEKYPDLITYTAGIIKKVFTKSPNIRKVKDSACYTVTLYQNQISHRLGIPVGNRSNLNFDIPDWILNNKDFLINFIRGLFKAEGSLSIHLPISVF